MVSNGGEDQEEHGETAGNGTVNEHGDDGSGGREERATEEEPQFNPGILVSDAMAKNSRQLLYAHIYNYLIQHKYYDTSRRLLDEADVPLSKPFPEDEVKSNELLHAKMLMNSRDTFLCEWWESLWTLHHYVESQPVEKISSSRLFHEPVTPILPQRPPATKGFATANTTWFQQQQYLPGNMGYNHMAPNPAMQTNMGPPRSGDVKGSKGGVTPASPLRKTPMAYPPPVHTTPGVVQNSMGMAGGAGTASSERERRPNIDRASSARHALVHKCITNG